MNRVIDRVSSVNHVPCVLIMKASLRKRRQIRRLSFSTERGTLCVKTQTVRWTTSEDLYGRSGDKRGLPGHGSHKGPLTRHFVLVGSTHKSKKKAFQGKCNTEETLESYSNLERFKRL